MSLRPTRRFIVSCNNEVSFNKGKSCLGCAFLESGHNLVPEPPDKITGVIILLKVLFLIVTCSASIVKKIKFYKHLTVKTRIYFPRELSASDKIILYLLTFDKVSVNSLQMSIKNTVEIMTKIVHTPIFSGF